MRIAKEKLFEISWWLKDGHWHKTKLFYILTGKHKRQLKQFYFNIGYKHTFI